MFPTSFPTCKEGVQPDRCQQGHCQRPEDDGSGGGLEAAIDGQDARQPAVKRCVAAERYDKAEQGQRQPGKQPAPFLRHGQQERGGCEEESHQSGIGEFDPIPGTPVGPRSASEEAGREQADEGGRRRQ